MEDVEKYVRGRKSRDEDYSKGKWKDRGTDGGDIVRGCVYGDGRVDAVVAEYFIDARDGNDFGFKKKRFDIDGEGSRRSHGNR